MSQNILKCVTDNRHINDARASEKKINDIFTETDKDCE